MINRSLARQQQEDVAVDVAIHGFFCLSSSATTAFIYPFSVSANVICIFFATFTNGVSEGISLISAFYILRLLRRDQHVQLCLHLLNHDVVLANLR